MENQTEVIQIVNVNEEASYLITLPSDLPETICEVEEHLTWLLEEIKKGF